MNLATLECYWHTLWPGCRRIGADGSVGVPGRLGLGLVTPEATAITGRHEDYASLPRCQAAQATPQGSPGRPDRPLDSAAASLTLATIVTGYC